MSSYTPRPARKATGIFLPWQRTARNKTFLTTVSGNIISLQRKGILFILPRGNLNIDHLLLYPTAILWHHQKTPTYWNQNKRGDRRYHTIITLFKQWEQNIWERGSLKIMYFATPPIILLADQSPEFSSRKQKTKSYFLSWKRGISCTNRSSSTCFSAKILHKCCTSDYIYSYGTAKFGVWDQSWRHWTVPQNMNFGTKVRRSAEGSEKSSSGACLPLAKRDNQLHKNLAGRDTTQSHLPQPWIKSWSIFKNRLYYGSLIKHTQTGCSPSVQYTESRGAPNEKPR